MSETTLGSALAEAAAGDFEPEQKRYLEGFVAGLQIAKTAKELSGANAPQVAVPFGVFQMNWRNSEARA